MVREKKEGRKREGRESLKCALVCKLPSSPESHTTTPTPQPPTLHPTSLSVVLNIKSGSFHSSGDFCFVRSPKGQGRGQSQAFLVKVGPRECLGLALGITVISGLSRKWS